MVSNFVDRDNLIVKRSKICAAFFIIMEKNIKKGQNFNSRLLCKELGVGVAPFVVYKGCGSFSVVLIPQV